ncbi:hypothetical protein [Couchioplanes azureus]|uniref:hypothetical protein n=1 Tax=Couchioplanes caeruleus TaxID=56438 RepID=UPI001670E892|nr:hypothetical protein [Couchioplanes caeruleus]GGQ79551.1 hypothetical protein GCM10010166_56980 [Couchioplanes caeruleus subsp. azureus]
MRVVATYMQATEISAAMSAVSATTAVAVLGWTVWRARNDERQKALDRRRAQAEAVTWFLDENPPSGSHHTRKAIDAAEFGASTEGMEFADLVVLNASTGCLYECVAVFSDFSRHPETEPLARRLLGVIPPGPTRIRLPMRFFPGEGSGAWRHIGAFQQNRPMEYLQFRDHDGITWKRTWLGELQELPYRKPGTDLPDYAP